MGDTVVTILAIVLAAVLMFVFPLMSVADRSDDVSQLSVQNSTTTKDKLLIYRTNSLI